MILKYIALKMLHSSDMKLSSWSVFTSLLKKKNTFNLVLAFLLVMIISWGPFILFSVCDFSLTEAIDYSWTKNNFFFSVRFWFTLKENCFCSVSTKDLMMFEVKQNDLVENISVRTTRLVIKDVIVNFQNMT